MKCSMRPTLSFDALTLHAVVDELRTAVLGGRVQRVAAPGVNVLGLEVYARGERTNLLISADPNAARVCVTRERLAQGSETATPLLLLLRKYVRDGRLVELRQPPLERVLELCVNPPAADRAAETGGNDLVRLIIEVMGRRSNAVLVAQDGTIMDALRRARREKNPSRPILPRLRYDPPPPQDRLDPFAEDTWEILREQRYRSPADPLAELLGAELRGFSPLLSREVAFRATGRTDAPLSEVDWPTLRRASSEMLAPVGGGGKWAPSVARWQGRVIGFAAYRLRHLEASCDVEDVALISEAVEVAYAGGGATAEAPRREATDQLVQPILDAIDARRSQVHRRRLALARARESAGDPEQLRTAGQTILAYLHTIQEGQDTLEVDGLTVPLDPRASGLENAQRYFRDYKKARDASRRVPELLDRAEAEAAYLDDMSALAQLVDDPGRLRALRAELRASGIVDDPRPIRKSRRGAGEEGVRPISVPLSDGLTALVGTSARTNERLTFDTAAQDDVWLHARQMPGAHVIVRTGGRQISPRALEEAASLAAYYSSGREAARVPVDWTLRKFVRKIRGGPPGRVSYINEQTVQVEPKVPSAAG
jgi:predicted ribosome quality control (RQC) complex YloA/Tae2 family protein